eukprot:TRINITY_DN17425_c0_g1_i3.p1 TRINITY_DN17425_c0_g1~~TRINITY_DN17425_c0_g1_i3.p1  ORF type:complete len:486 (-),score=145.07 TRINITY_DN17425_c0_g1_i3:547-2004(-)
MSVAGRKFCILKSSFAARSARVLLGAGRDAAQEDEDEEEHIEVGEEPAPWLEEEHVAEAAEAAAGAGQAAEAPAGPPLVRKKATGCTFHVIYWEEGAPDVYGMHGVHFGEPLERAWQWPGRHAQLPLKAAPGPGPSLCRECDGVAGTTMCHMDSMHAAVRMLAKERTGFRTEVQEFMCLSSNLALRIHLQGFRQFNAKLRKKVLTEATVLGVPMKVYGGEMPDGKDSGVVVKHFRPTGGGSMPADDTLERSLKGYAGLIRRLAEGEGGVSAVAVLHPFGTEVNGFGAPVSYFAKHVETPITRVILLVAGPGGFVGGKQARQLKDLERMLMKPSEGCHLGPYWLSVPSAGAYAGNRMHCRASFAALGDLFMFHDRGLLMPVLEDIRAVGEKDYEAFVQLLRGALSKFSKTSWDFDRKLGYLQGWGRTLEKIAQHDPLEAAERAAAEKKQNGLGALKEDASTEAPETGTASSVLAEDDDEEVDAPAA